MRLARTRIHATVRCCSCLPEAAEGRQDGFDTPLAACSVSVSPSEGAKGWKEAKPRMATSHHGSKICVLSLIHPQLLPTPTRQFLSSTLSLAFHFGKTHKINSP